MVFMALHSLTFPRRGKVARSAGRGMLKTEREFVFDIPLPPFGHLPPSGGRD